MYEKHWKLREKPFENTPDPKYLYLSPQHKQALMNLIYAVRENKGAAMLTGYYGCGKTLLTRALIGYLDANKCEVALLTNPHWDAEEFLIEILYQFGIDERIERKTAVLRRLNDVFYANARASKDTIIIIDEAQVIEDEMTFEELRLLLNFQLNDRFLLTLVLAGQPELRERVRSIPQLDQRIGIKSHLVPLSSEETKKYITYRCSIAGSDSPLFSDAAIDLIFKHTEGIPRKINNLCDIALVIGFSRTVPQVDIDIIQGLSQMEGGL